MRATLCFVGLALLGPSLLAEQQLTVRGVLHTGNFNTFRVVGGRGSTVVDVTSDGLRVGFAPGPEERIAFCRPAFFGDVAPLVNYTVTSAAPEGNSVQASYFVPTRFWDGSTSPSSLFSMKDENPAAATPDYMAGLFNKLLKSQNNPSANLGFLVRGSGDFRRLSNLEVFFQIQLSIPFVVAIRNFGPMCPDPRTNPTPPTPQPIPDYVMYWSSTLSGKADITVNNAFIYPIPIRVVGQRVSETIIPNQVLARGPNRVAVAVLPDDASVNQAPVTTSVTLTIGDVICPFF
ncbi:MAG: hypothetical protein HY815_28965 [Candidatus Riflebacteria bacterium]|nr:hypothetical protein [Candidatus Riflebacteria bacterium]